MADSARRMPQITQTMSQDPRVRTIIVRWPNHPRTVGGKKLRFFSMRRVWGSEDGRSMFPPWVQSLCRNLCAPISTSSGVAFVTCSMNLPSLTVLSSKPPEIREQGPRTHKRDDRPTREAGFVQDSAVKTVI